jgi:Flp pilus assembly protein TadG
MGALRRVLRQERGANLIEFAILAPLLILLLLGIVEFGWVFGQYNDVRHGAREGARFAAVNAGDQNAIATYVCNTMDLSAGVTLLTIDLTKTGGGLGQTGTITVTADIDSLSNVPLISTFLPTQLTSTVEFRIEQPATWANGTVTRTPGSC